MTRAMLLCALLSSTAARADKWTWGPPSALQLDPALEVGLLAISLPAWLLPHYFDPGLAQPSCGQPGNLCDLSTVPWFDRPMMYYNPGMRPFADFAFSWGPIVIAPLLFLDYGPARWRDFLKDTLVLFEAWAWAGTLTHLLRYAVRRPRPYLYYADWYPDEHGGANSTMSFPAGHVSEVFGFTIAAAYVFMLRRGGNWRTIVMWCAMLGLGTAVAILRVGSGDHFASDALTGVLVGTTAGTIIPWLHKPRGRVTLTLLPSYSDGYAGVALGGRF